MSTAEQPFSLEDCAAYPYAAGVPGTIVDIAGAFSVAGRSAVTSATIRGDNAVLATASSFDSTGLTLEIHQHHLTSLAAVGAGIFSTTGTGGTLVNTLLKSSTDVYADFKLEAQTHSKDSGGGGFRWTFYRCQWASGPDFTLADSAFAPVTLTATAIPDATFKVFQIDQYATFAALA